ncbi:MAG: hypothetical protein C7N36_08350 [Bacteroidetes bacterium]|nr:MAG: hypothetical protein C7N36_08350 [Bacteroidota bacterium]
MSKRFFGMGWCCLLGLAVTLSGQRLETDIKIYDFADGLSHRNIFAINQDANGLIWLATINGLNAFDGYSFRTYNSSSATGQLANDQVTGLLPLPNGELLLGSPDYLTTFSPRREQATAHQIKPGQLVRRQSLTPNNLCLANGQVWCTVFDEKNGQNWLAKYQPPRLQLVRSLPGARTRRPLAFWQGQLLLAGEDNQLVYLDTLGGVLQSVTIGAARTTRDPAHIVDLQVCRNELWLLLDDGQVFVQKNLQPPAQRWGRVPLGPETTTLNSLWVETDGNLWVGGLGTLWHYRAWQQEWQNFDETIRQQLKNTCNYRQIFQDRTGSIWIATDFGALKITQSDRLFAHYLSGGSEYCSNIYCSTRGMAEDDQGNIYVSYYNAIHVIDGTTHQVRPLFPKNNYFNYPFGLAYYQDALYTGNGIRIDLKTLRQDTLFTSDHEDLGAVIVDRKGQIWLGYQNRLLQYDPRQKQLQVFTDSQGQWDSLAGNISYLYESTAGDIWVGTADNGAFCLRQGLERTRHYTTGATSLLRLPHQQVNAILETAPGWLWMGTARGLVRIDEASQTVHTFTQANGLTNDFINGILPEGDSCLWISTDNGLSRLSIANGEVLNFFTTDGLSSNEFNRISFLRTRSGSLYFGGLNGVNGFAPDERYRKRKKARQSATLVLTSFSYLDGRLDSVVHHTAGADPAQTPFQLTYHDRMFTVQFAMMDFRHPEQNSFQHYLEGYEPGWSAASNVPFVRYTDLKPGQYTLHVRGRVDREDWNEQELLVPIEIAPAYYQHPWFWPLVALLGLGLVGGLMQFRVYTLNVRRSELEREVDSRTRELAAEKQKSEELLLNILPAGLAEELKENGFAKAKRHEMVTVMFSDFKGFSLISEQLEPEELVAEIDLCFRAFDEITERHGLEKIKTIGDAYLLVGGITEAAENQAKKVVLAALEIQEFMAAIAVERRLHQQHFFEARIGIHTGPLVAGIVGIKKFAYDIWGDTVNIASRMETHGVVGKVNVSGFTYELVKADFRFTPNGRYTENNTDLDMYVVKEYTETTGVFKTK